MVMHGKMKLKPSESGSHGRGLLGYRRGIQQRVAAEWAERLNVLTERGQDVACLEEHARRAVAEALPHKQVMG